MMRKIVPVLLVAGCTLGRLTAQTVPHDVKAVMAYRWAQDPPASLVALRLLITNARSENLPPLSPDTAANEALKLLASSDASKLALLKEGYKNPAFLDWLMNSPSPALPLDSPPKDAQISAIQAQAKRAIDCIYTIPASSSKDDPSHRSGVTWLGKVYGLYNQDPNQAFLLLLEGADHIPKDCALSPTDALGALRTAHSLQVPGWTVFSLIDGRINGSN